MWAAGTGLSTEPLTSFAPVVIGVDMSEEMLRARAEGGRASYVRARAERLPFRDGTFDLATVACAIHWLDAGALAEIGRVLTGTAWLAVYNVRFGAEMAGQEAFASWMSEECGPGYPPVAKRRFRRASVARNDFALAWKEELRASVPMSLRALRVGLMTHSERIAAIRDGRESEAEQARYFADAPRPFFSDDSVRQSDVRICDGGLLQMTG